LVGALGDFVEFFFADHVDRGFDQVADHGFDVAADVADLGVLRGFHFYEWAAGETREASRDFRFADAGRTDHQNIFRQDFLGEFGGKFLAANAIAQGHGHGALGGGLADDVLIELGDDFARRQLVEGRLRLGFRLALLTWKIDHHNWGPLKLLDRDVAIGKDADFAGHAHGFLRDFLGAELGVAREGPRGGEGVRSAGADGAEAVIGLNHIAIAGEQKRAFGIGDDEKRFKMSQGAIFAPVFGELDGGALQIAVKFLELVLEALEKRKRVGRGARETGQDFTVEQAANFFRRVLHHVLA